MCRCAGCHSSQLFKNYMSLSQSGSSALSGSISSPSPGDKKGKMSPKGRVLSFQPPHTRAAPRCRNRLACLHGHQPLQLAASAIYFSNLPFHSFQLVGQLPKAGFQRACCSVDQLQREERARSNPFSNKENIIALKSLCVLFANVRRREVTNGTTCSFLQVRLTSCCLCPGLPATG